MDITKKETSWTYKIVLTEEDRNKLITELPTGNIQNGSILQKLWEGLQNV